jgi:hypothetical protein
VNILDLRIIPLAGESLGTRSMAIAVQGKKSQVILDPGVDVAPRRYDLPPHSMELKRRHEHRENILSEIKKLPVACFWVSHYHFDHFPKINEAVKIDKAMYHWDPKLQEFPKSDFLIKDPKENINKNQTRRARKFTRALKKLNQNFLSAENVSFQTPEFSISGSPILPHGEISLLGYVVGCSITYRDTKLLFTGDIVGMPLKEHTDWIIAEQPDILIMDGPMKDQLSAFKSNIKTTINKTNIKQLVIEHHLLRSKNWKELIEEDIEYIQDTGTKVGCYADLLGRKIELLEVSRKDLFEFLPESAPIHTKGYKHKKKP